MHYTTTQDGTQIAYQVTGDGPALLLLHGFGDDHTVWEPVIDAFKDDFTLIAPDLRGCGASDKPTDPDRYTSMHHIGDIGAVLGACQVEQFLLWGWSFGGTLGLQLAAHAQALRAAVIAGTRFGRIFTPDYVEQVLGQIDKLAALSPEALREAIGEAGAERFLANDRDVVRARWRGVQTWPGVEPQDIKVPTLVYTGTEDVRVVDKLEVQREAIDAAPVTEFRLFEGVDHKGLIQDIEIVTSEVKPFLLQFV